MQSKITIRGMYQYNDHLFDTLTFPVGVDKDVAVERILNKSEEFEVVYSNFDYLQQRMASWSKTYERTFERWVKALSIDYEPLYNYDRYEESDDDAKSHSSTSTSSSTSSGTENKVSAYDEIQYSNKEKVDSSATASQGGLGDAESENHHKAHLYGNIGVTTSQQMLRDELDLATWSLYDHIADLFIEEFCILIY